MTDCKVIKILKQMREEERKLIAADFDTETTIGFTHGDKVEALNVAIFELENRDKFYIPKKTIKDKIKEIEDSLKEDCIALHEFQRLAKIDVLKEILGE